jgi:uncharacterized protein (DUF1800 family)
MTTVEAFIAANRFGLGPRLGSLAGIAPDPQGWLLRQLGPADGATPHLRGLPTSRDVLSEFFRIRKDRDARKRFRKEKAGPLYREETARRTLAAVRTDTPFRERLVQFWSNHFTVSVTRGQIRPLVGAFEREAIRPHVTGTFADMLLAVTQHPVMLSYLDNVASIGPNSRAGQRRKRGLNENLAREILELHTLGVDGGYVQDDVVALAKILTGWSVGNMKSGKPGAFAFFDRRHEPGSKHLLGRRYAESGAQEGEVALKDLASHPSTARFIATKLARHFIADNPPRTAVNRLRKNFSDTGGDLAAMARTLVKLSDAWADPLAKVKTPNELIVSTFRLLGPPTKPAHMVGPLRLMGQLPFFAPSPAGWPDRAESWIGPESLLLRIEILELVSKRYARRIDPRQLSDEAFGPVAQASTVAAIRRAESQREALALMLASREFQRR